MPHDDAPKIVHHRCRSRDSLWAARLNDSDIARLERALLTDLSQQGELEHLLLELTPEQRAKSIEAFAGHLQDDQPPARATIPALRDTVRGALERRGAVASPVTVLPFPGRGSL